MADVIAEFFDDLVKSEVTLQRATGTLRFDIDEGQVTDRWFVSVDRGAVSVSRRNSRASCVVRADRATFEKVLNGELNPLTSMLRGLITVDISGATELLVLVQRYARARAYRLALAGGPARRASAPKGRRR